MAWHALQFARALAAQGHELVRVFFYGNGVHHASALLSPPQDEPNLHAGWLALRADTGAELVVCVAAALQRGVLDATTARQQEKPVANVADGYAISGLGQLVEAALIADRLVTFAE